MEEKKEDAPREATSESPAYKNRSLRPIDSTPKSQPSNPNCLALSMGVRSLGAPSRVLHRSLQPMKIKSGVPMKINTGVSGPSFAPSIWPQAMYPLDGPTRPVRPTAASCAP
jgi:hypothetical protein